MRVGQLKELFRQLTQEYFSNANVTFAKQSRVAKPTIPLVTLTPGLVRRNQFPNDLPIDATPVLYYPSRLSLSVDLFTHGKAVTETAGGVVKTVAYEDTSVEDMLSFSDFLNSRYATEWLSANDVSVLTDGDVQCLTGLINDTTYEFRSRLNLFLYFTQISVGVTGVLSEESIQEQEEGGE